MADTAVRRTTMLLLYDDGCGFCRWCVGLVLAWDRRRRLHAVPIESANGEELLAGLTLDERLGSWHFVDAVGRVWSGGTAFAPLGRVLPGGRVMTMLAELSPAATERAYRLIADNRGRASRFVPAGWKRRADQRIRRRSADEVLQT
jgi:predicted DCC family thiol-disulfide oxidoreductase YuxK